MNDFTRRCGFALIAGGGLLILINTVLTPMMPYDQSDAVVRSSTIYLARLSVSGVDAMLLVFGCLGVHLAQRDKSGWFGMIAFVLAFVGTVLLVAVEWSNVFVLRPVAQADPETLEAIGNSPLLIGGFTASVSLFGLGWLLLGASAWWTNVLDRWASAAVVAGLILTTALTPIGLWGAIAGSTVIGVGMIGMGRSIASK